MKILIAAANHDSFDSLKIFVNSIKSSFENCKTQLELKIVIADNSKKFITLNKSSPLNVDHVKVQNLGYLNSIQSAIDKVQINLKDFNFVIISNVDVALSTNFFQILTNVEINPCIGWIAPSIISKVEGLDRNPKIITRPSLLRLQILQTMYRYPILFRVYNNFIYRQRRKNKIKTEIVNIYAGHGSLMIFTDYFIKTIENFKYFSFLFNEEIHFAELVARRNLKTIYMKELVVEDGDHVSTSKIPSKELMNLNVISLKNIIDNYFNGNHE